MCSPEELDDNDLVEVFTRIRNLFVYDIGSGTVYQLCARVSVRVTIVQDFVSSIDLPVSVGVADPDIGVKVVSGVQQYIVSTELNRTGVVTVFEVIQQEVGGSRSREPTIVKIRNRRVVGDLVVIDNPFIGRISDIFDLIRTGVNKVKTVFSNPYPHPDFRNRITLFYQVVWDGKSDFSTGRIVHIGDSCRQVHVAFIQSNINRQHIANGVVGRVVITRIYKGKHIVEVLTKVYPQPCNIITSNVFHLFFQDDIGLDDFDTEGVEERIILIPVGAESEGGAGFAIGNYRVGRVVQ